MMKRNIYFILILFVAALSSCVTNDISIVKRKYSPGYYVSVNHHKNIIAPQKTNENVIDSSHQDQQKIETSFTEVKELKTSITETLLAEEKVNRHQQNYTASKSKLSPFLSLANNKQTLANNTNKAEFGKVNSHNLVDKSKIKDTKIKALLKAGNKTQAELILLVILSLFPFLALLAMYLKDGEEITMNFWVDLILHLTVVGYLIFALLVVFDVINLA